jgi:histidinol dehydrogenase
VAGALEVPRAELAAAEKRLEPEAVKALRLAARRIADFHRRQLTKGWRYRDDSGLLLGQKVQPLERVGVYVPGGRASYPSSVLMNVIPAKVAGVAEVIAVSPPSPASGSYDAVLAAAAISGVDRFFRVGGAQAVAALAFGTESVPRVDKIVGPGNVWVQTAKKLVFGRVGIDNFAAASEVLVIADRMAHPDWIAADLLSQAEHDEMASAVCVTDSERIGTAVVEEVGRQVALLAHRETAEKALARFGGVFVVRNLEQAIEVANEIAPEHLELAVVDPERWLKRVRHAGAVFLGSLAPEPLGDYLAGPNHVLPTGGTARFGSPLGVYDFIKRTSVIGGSRRALERLGPAVVLLATLEGLDAHARAVEIRLRPKKARRR